MVWCWHYFCSVLRHCYSRVAIATGVFAVVLPTKCDKYAKHNYLNALKVGEIDSGWFYVCPMFSSDLMRSNFIINVKVSLNFKYSHTHKHAHSHSLIVKIWTLLGMAWNDLVKTNMCGYFFLSFLCLCATSSRFLLWSSAHIKSE